MKSRITLVAFMMVTIASLGLSSNTAFAGELCIPPEIPDGEGGCIFPPEPCETHAEFDGSVISGAGTTPFFTDSTPCPASVLGLFPISASMTCGPNIFGPGEACHVILPNWQDDLDTKVIFVDISYDEEGEGPFPFAPASIVCHDPTLPEGAGPGSTIFFGPGGFELFFYDLECLPNPDWEEIDIILPSSTFHVGFWTHSFDEEEEDPVGGAFVPIDNSALILAGAQSISMWMIPVVIAGIGVAIFVIKRRN